MGEKILSIEGACRRVFSICRETAVPGAASALMTSLASVRHPIHVLEAARMGAHVVTVPYKVLSQLAQHPLTDIGLARFLADWEKVPKQEAPES